jgi:type I restriction enzyme, R subunit
MITPKPTSEAAFEAYVVEHLTTTAGYTLDPPTDFDRELALRPADLLAYIQTTQPKTWTKQQTIHGTNLPKTLLAAFDKATATDGILAVLRHGFKFYGSRIRVATFAPAHGLNPEIAAHYAANRLAVVRQLHHDPADPKLSIDLTLFLNGIPLATLELKNALTSQYAEDAKRQYTERNYNAPIFRFKRRTLVHFAVGSDEVWMTTHLAGPKTVFLPFNRGHGTAAGNPPVPDKHRTCYLWEEVLSRESLLDIVARFVHVETDDETKRERMIFPRYHQLDCVRKLVGAARTNGAGTNYLVQHSAGSGKSHSIGWLAHRLASLHDEHDRKTYDSVIVITDRRVLDQQLQNTIYQIDHKQGVVRKIEDGHNKSEQPAEALVDNTPVVVCTIHSFGFVSQKIESLPERRYAVIVDEAHSSQSGDMASNMKEVLSASAIATRFEEEAEDTLPADQAALLKSLKRGPQPNLSFFAFTATPKFKTLELFGHKGADGRPAPFHLYSMRQAITEGFILDVLRGYTTYKRYFKLVKAIEDDPELPKKKAGAALARFVSLHPVNVAQKTEVIIEHFRRFVKHLLGGHAKAMVVTGSRVHAVKYKLAFDAYLAAKGYDDVGVLVAFSGEVVDPDDPTNTKQTEPGMNKDRVTGRPIKETELPKKFASDLYNVLIVANKYQTGFDEPRLCAMYVDKRLAGIQAVQTLSRLNRTAAGKEQTFVLDFVNEREEILASFQDYYESTTTDEPSDPQRLYELQSQLDATQVYHRSEVDLFARILLDPKPAADANARLNAALDPAKDRFNALDEAPAEAFRKQLQAYCNLYAFLAQIVAFADPDLEKLYLYGKMLLRKLPGRDTGTLIVFGDDVALHYYRLQKETEGALSLAAEGVGIVYGPSATGTREPKDDKEKLSRLIDQVNDRFGTAFDAQDIIDGVTGQLLADQGMQRAATANDRANFELVGAPAFDEALIDRHAKHASFIDRVFSDEELLRFIRAKVLDEVYARLNEPPPGR